MVTQSVVPTFCILWLTMGLAAVQSSAADFTKLCRLFKPNTILAIPEECDKYIKCSDNGNGQVFQCGGESSFFDVKTQKCIKESSKDSICSNRCEGKNDIWIADPTTCHGFFYCRNGEALLNYCYDGMHFDESQQMCIPYGSSSCIDVPSLCELVPDKTKFLDETDCSRYYECASKKQSRKSCSKTYFDVKSQACVDKTKVPCTAHPIPAKICIENKKPFVGFKPDQASCRGYFSCANLGIVEDLEPKWRQCSEGLFFSYTDQACKEPRDVKCDYNRCEGRGNQMVSSSNNNCHNYLICENNFAVAEKTCAYDYFFDEVYQACVPDIIYYKCCDKPEKK